MSNLAIFFPNTRLPELGKIKVGGLGEPKQSQAGGAYRVPMKYDHFLITTMSRGPDKGGARGDLIPDVDLMDQLKAKYADPTDGQLRQIPIFVLSDDIDEVMQTAYVWYGGKVVGARSDGRRVTWFNDRTNGKPLAKPIEEDWKPEYLELKNSKGALLFKLHTCLNVVIGAAEAKWGGVYKFRTTSVISSRQLYAGLLHIWNLTGGILVGLPLRLVVRPVQVAPEGKAITVYVVHIELRGGELEQVQLEATKRAQWQLENKQRVKVLQIEYHKLLSAPGNEPPSEAAEINEEFQPDTVGDAPPPPPVDAYWHGVLDGKGPVIDAESRPVESPEPGAAEAEDDPDRPLLL